MNNTLITDMKNNRAELLATFNKEMEALEELSRPILNAVELYEAQGNEQEELSAKIADIEKQLNMITSTEQGGILTVELQKLQAQRSFLGIVKKNRLPKLAKQLEALAIPYYKQETRASQALQSLYIGVYRTTNPVTLETDLKAMQMLGDKKSWNGSTVKNALVKYGVLGLGNRVVEDKDGNRVAIGGNSGLKTRELEDLEKALYKLKKSPVFWKGL